MSGQVVVLAVKSGLKALTDERTKTGIATLLCVLLSPLILIICVIVSLAGGAAEHNRSTVTYCFDSSLVISTSAPDEFVNHVTEMRSCFATIDAALATMSVPDDSDPIDSTLIKAVFYGLHYEDDHVQLDEATAQSFISCFVTEQDEGDEDAPPDEDDHPDEDEDDEDDDDEDADEEEDAEEPDGRQVIPISELQVIFQNVATQQGRSISPEEQAACLEVYYMIRYGDASLAANTDDLLAALVNGESEYVGGVAGSPFEDDWRPRVTSEIGIRISPIDGSIEGHRGIDLANAYGTPIRAVASGTVVLARYDHPSYGNYVVLDHGSGTTTLYAHCSSLCVTVGQQVNAGDMIAKVGSTGDSTGNHLHLEVKVGGQLVNPRTFLQ